MSFASALGALGTGISTVTGVAGAIQANNAAKVEADQLEMKAAEERAVAQRQAMEERRQSRILQSNAIAMAAAGGGSPEDPGIMDLLLDINDQGEQNARTATYQGELGARNSIYAASARRAQGKQAMWGGILGAGGTLLSGLGDIAYQDKTGVRSYAEKYGAKPAGSFG